MTSNHSRHNHDTHDDYNDNEDLENGKYRIIHHEIENEELILETRNIAQMLFDRACGGSVRRRLPRSRFGDKFKAQFARHDLTNELRRFGEAYSVMKFRSDYLDMGTSTVSTISVAFSPDGKTLASTHGDHTVKISCCYSGRHIRSLVGHPRTPWTVKFHPKDSNICASGCIGYQVRVWDINNGVCSKMVRLDSAIISLSFHPMGDLLSVACGNRLILWDYVNRDSPNHQFVHEHALRCVCFLPQGDKIIVGGLVKKQHVLDRGTFALFLWDFNYNSYKATRRLTAGSDEASNGLLTRSILTNCRKFLSRALLYNDGGFDISPCGRYLVACSEWWLPDGIDCIMDLLRARRLEAGLQENHDKLKALSLHSAGSNDEGNDDDSAVEVDIQINSEVVPASPPHHAVNRSTPRSPPPPPAVHTRRRNVDSLLSLSIENNSSNTMASQMSLSHPPPPQRRRTDFTTFVSKVMSRTATDQRISNSQQGQNIVENANEGVGESGSIPIQQRDVRAAPNSETSRWAREAAFRMAFAGGGYPFRRDGTAFQFGRGMLSPDSIKDLGRYVPHVVLMDIDHGGEILGRLVDACPLDESRAGGVTCVKFSPSTNYCLLGYGVRENEDAVGDRPPHQVTSLFRVKEGMRHMVSLMSLHDDVNIARFHPDSGHGFVYGTKQGRLRVLSPKPWTSPMSS